MVPAPVLLPRCEEVAERLSEFLDEELGPIATARVTLHLALCTACARFAYELAATVRALHRLPRRAEGPSCPVVR
jgi:anti-sigma factor RsiW